MPPSQTIQERDITLGAHRVHIYIAGPQGARTVVLVHGIGVSTRYFLPFLAEMAKVYRVVSIDLPSFGKSSRPAELLTIPDFARVVGQVLDSLAIEKPVLVGHSMGCQVVAELMRQRPKITDKIILMGPTVDDRHRGLMRHIFLLLRECLREPWRLNKVVLSDYAKSGPWHYIKALGPMLRDHIEEKLTGCKAKVFIMRGERDVIVPREWAARLSRLTPRSSLVEVPGCAHVFQFVDPVRTSHLCQEFIEA